MRPWAQWTAKTALLAAGVCDNAGALLGVVGAAFQVGTAVLPPASPCGSAAAVLGDSTAARAARWPASRSRGPPQVPRRAVPRRAVPPRA